jgi:hypothetical protein
MDSAQFRSDRAIAAHALTIACDDRPVSSSGERYRGLASSVADRPWWERVPRPVRLAALAGWNVLPRFVRAPLVPLGGLFGPHTTATAVSPGAESVAGVEQLMREGYEPVENYTGAVWVAELWPGEHRRSVPETRTSWLDDELDGRLWLVRSPWATLTLDEVFALLWRWVERDHQLDNDIWRERVAEVLAWSQPQAVAWHRKSRL